METQLRYSDRAQEQKKTKKRYSGIDLFLEEPGESSNAPYHSDVVYSKWRENERDDSWWTWRDSPSDLGFDNPDKYQRLIGWQTP
jgi:hypothetical protein